MIRANMLESLADNIVIRKDKCTSCGICVETCILDNLRMKLVPCRQACPLGVNCQGYVGLIAWGEEAKALELLRETCPFPGILGRICSQPCEEECHRKKMDGEAIAIRALKRYLTEIAPESGVSLPEMKPDTGHKCAVIGSGPAGMMAAHDLRLQGHAVTVFEAETAPGGMLRWAIPEFRLPLDVLDEELDLLRSMGVDFQCGIRIGEDKSLNEVKKEFHAVVIATGCPHYVKLNIDGEDLPGVYHGIPFLRKVREGQAPQVGEKVVVIGGGNAAVDAAQTARRLGAQDVTIVSLESRDEIPAFPTALEGALSEGIRLECSWGPVRFSSLEDGLKGVELQRCLRVFNDRGEFSPLFDSGQVMSLASDTVIVAVGLQPDLEFLADLGMSPKMAQVDSLTLQTPDEMIFMAGDVIDGPSSVVEAMSKGRRAAESAHRFLMGEHLRYGREYPGPIETDFEIDTTIGTPIGRAKIMGPQFQGKGDFREIEKPFNQEIAREEAGRCHACGQPFGKFRTCWFCLPCEVVCPHEALYVEIPYLLR